MEFRYKRTVAPTTTPISLDEAKDQLRHVDSDDDSEITRMISAATEYLDGPFGVLGRCIVSQTWTVSTTFPQAAGTNGHIPIRIGYLQSVTSIAYVDSDGNAATVDMATVTVITGEDGLLYLKAGASWPETDADTIDPVTITVVVGYPDAGGSPAVDGLRANVPDSLRHAMNLHVSHMFEHRDVVGFGATVVEIPKTFDTLIAPYRLTKHGEA